MKLTRITQLFSLLLLLFAGGTSAQVADTVEEQVQTMYIAYYGRPGDPGGVAFWTAQLTEAGGDLTQIIDAFGTSPEYESRFGGLSDEALVDNLYQQLLGRAADAAGKDFYLGELDAGRMTLPTIALNIADGVRDGDSDFSTVTNRLAMAVQFTSRVSSDGLTYDESSISGVVALLATVGADAGSVDDALAEISDLFGDGGPIDVGGEGIAFRFDTEEGILACSGSIPIPDSPIPPVSLIVYLQFDGDTLTIPPAEDYTLEGFTIVEDTGMQGGYNESDGTFSLSQTMTGYSNDDPSQALQTISFTTEGQVTADSWFGTYAFSVSLSVSGFDIDCNGMQDFFGERLD